MATLPDGLEEIGSYAFSECKNINLPVSLKRIGDYAFGDISGDIDLPELEYIGRNAFANSSIHSFKFSDKLVGIGAEAFAATPLKEVYIPTAPDTIPAGLFCNCEFLEKVNIKGNSTTLGEEAFYKCDAITELSLPSTIEEVGKNSIPDHLLPEAEEGIIYYGKTAYRTSSDQSEYTIKDGTVCLAEDLFNWHLELTKITLPVSLRRIGKNAFSNTSLTVTPEMDGVTHIGDEAFANCYNLARVVIPESVEYVGRYVFRGCDNIWNVTTSREVSAAVRSVSESDYVKLYSIRVTPEQLGIEEITDGSETDSNIIEYYTIDGLKVDAPSTSGVYIIRRANGKISKILIH